MEITDGKYLLAVTMIEGDHCTKTEIEIRNGKFLINGFFQTVGEFKSRAKKHGYDITLEAKDNGAS